MSDRKRYTVRITGIVQGVGVRPYIYKEASRLHLAGRVSNQGDSVIVDISGDKKNIKEFLNTLLKNPPAGASIRSLRIKPEPYMEQTDFFIAESSSDRQYQGFIPPDTAICDECIKEMNDATNRRYLYPFTNCSCCGPRYSIIKELPYDRKNTSMSVYEMCPLCRAEYENPDNRRFHAQTICCPDCGPKLVLLDRNGNPADAVHPINTARQLLLEGKVIAVKGIGGYHLACNACDEQAIELLRKRKRRPDKPLAIMAASLDDVRLICNTTCKEEEILNGRKKPIVLLEKKCPERLPHLIAPGMKRFGVMVPYTPLHRRLFNQELHYLVMTSGNAVGAPICFKDEDALEKLKDIADFFLVHDREILTPIDDSVVRVIEENEMVSRSARGYSPEVFKMDSEHEMMAMGAEQKSSLCLLHRGYAHITQYMGDLKNYHVYREYLNVAERTKVLFHVEPQYIAHDLNMGYLSSQNVVMQSASGIPIQHHHAHMASCMAEHGLEKDVIGIIYDGTGLGADRTIWGGEFLIGTKSKFSRVGHWKTVMLQGGNSAVKEPWKSAASYLYAMGMDSVEYLKDIDVLKLKALQHAIGHHLNRFESSSMGRLFDCVSALVMNRLYITYDAQAAIELENVADPHVTDFYPYKIDETEEKTVIGYESIIAGILNDLKTRIAASCISAKFHNSVCKATVDCACNIRGTYGVNTVVLSGGVFENVYLLTSVMNSLKNNHFDVYCNRRVPGNDGGVAFGQIAVASKVMKEEKYVLSDSGKDCIGSRDTCMG